MAEFCNHCIKHIFPNAKPDIDVYAIFETLTPGHMQQVLCEGCGMLAVVKTEKEELKVLYNDDLAVYVDYYDKRER